MLFKLCYTVNLLDIPACGLFEFNLGGPAAIRLVLRSPTDEERSKGHRSFNAVLDVLGEIEPTKKSLPGFTALIEGRRPPEGQKATSAEEMIIREGPSYGLEYYPNPFVSFVDTVRDKLSKAGYAFVGVLRWRYAQEGPPSPICSRVLLCSNDAGVSWHPIPGRYSIVNVTPPHTVFVIQETDVNEIRDLIDTGEPVYHELMREAKELQHSSPRSSVLIAVSAAEVAVKSVVMNKVSETKWLFDNIQSPPVVKILIQYLPELFQDEKRFYEAKKEDRLIKTIEYAVNIRNEIVHKGEGPPSTEKVSEIIDAVQELLWICDYYSGYRWAELHINAMRRVTVKLDIN
ncbi:hypothetical protein KA005_10065, partial [bacterium]|nr:hypothetical protein [bacterium]